MSDSSTAVSANAGINQTHEIDKHNRSGRRRAMRVARPDDRAGAGAKRRRQARAARGRRPAVPILP